MKAILKYVTTLSAGATMRIILDIGGSVAIIVSACTVILYTLLGGLYSVAYTDVIQLVFITLSLASPVHFFVNGFLTKGQNLVLLFSISQAKNNSNNPWPTVPFQENGSPERSYGPYAFHWVLTQAIGLAAWTQLQNLSRTILAGKERDLSTEGTRWLKLQIHVLDDAKNQKHVDVESGKGRKEDS